MCGIVYIICTFRKRCGTGNTFLILILSRCGIGSAVDKKRRDAKEVFLAEMNEKGECNLILARSDRY